MSASFAGRKEERDRERSSLKGKPLCVGFSFSLGDVLVIHHSEFLSRPTTSCGSILFIGLVYQPFPAPLASELCTILQADFAECIFHALG